MLSTWWWTQGDLSEPKIFCVQFVIEKLEWTWNINMCESSKSELNRVKCSLLWLILFIDLIAANQPNWLLSRCDYWIEWDFIVCDSFSVYQINYEDFWLWHRFVICSNSIFTEIEKAKKNNNRNQGWKCSFVRFYSKWPYSRRRWNKRKAKIDIICTMKYLLRFNFYSFCFHPFLGDSSFHFLYLHQTRFCFPENWTRMIERT